MTCGAECGPPSVPAVGRETGGGGPPGRRGDLGLGVSAVVRTQEEEKLMCNQEAGYR